MSRSSWLVLALSCACGGDGKTDPVDSATVDTDVPAPDTDDPAPDTDDGTTDTDEPPDTDPPTGTPPGTTPNLVVNPGFELPEDICSFPDVFGDWGLDYAEISAAAYGVTPRSGVAMLDLVSTNFDDSGATCTSAAIGSSADVAQLVDMTGCEGATLRWTVHFDGTDAAPADCMVRSYDGAPEDFPPATPLGQDNASVQLDADPATWEACVVEHTVAAGATYAAVYIGSTRPDLVYADDVTLEVVAGACPSR